MFVKKYDMDQMISEVAETIFDGSESIWKQKMNMESTPEHYAYYYEQMNAEDQQRYRQLLYVIQQHGKNLNVSVMDMETIERIFQYILLDNPELFYVDNLETQTITVANVKSMMTVATIENMDMQKQSGAQKTIDEFRDDFLEQISETMGEEEKAELAFSYVVEQSRKKAANAKTDVSIANEAGSTCRIYSLFDVDKNYFSGFCRRNSADNTRIYL